MSSRPPSTLSPDSDTLLLDLVWDLVRMCDLDPFSAILNFMTESHFSENYFSIFLTVFATKGSDKLTLASLMLNEY